MAIELLARPVVDALLKAFDRARDARITDDGASVVLTYWPSEFSQLRGQYRFTRYGAPFTTATLPASKDDAHELLLQLQFSLGAHGAHPF